MWGFHVNFFVQENMSNKRKKIQILQYGIETPSLHQVNFFMLQHITKRPHRLENIVLLGLLFVWFPIFSYMLNLSESAFELMQDAVMVLDLDQ